MLAASLLLCLSASRQVVDAPKLKDLWTPRTATFAYGVFESEIRHRQNGADHWHRPLIANGGGLILSDSGSGVFSMSADWHESRAKVMCDGSILCHIGKIKRTEARLVSVRDEKGQIQSVQAHMRVYFPDPHRTANLDPLHRTSADPPWDVKHERLQGYSTVEGKRTPKGFAFTQVGNAPVFGLPSDRIVKVGDTSKLFVSTAEALLTDANRLKKFASLAKKGERAEFEVLSMPGIVRYQLHYVGAQWIVFKDLNATLDRFELRMTNDRNTPCGSFWLDERGDLALFWDFGRFDLGYTAMHGAFGTPSAPQVDTTKVWPVMMTFEQIWNLPRSLGRAKETIEKRART